jgi:DNA-binding transcriptional ArsR family regulator
MISKKEARIMDESLFIRELGIKSPMLKVLDFLIDNESFDYSKTDIAEGIGLSRATLFKAWPKLEALDLITATRTVGQAKMYKLNKQNPIVKKLMELDDAISEYFALKHCNPEGCTSNDFSDVVGPGQDLIKAVVEYEKDSHSDKRGRKEEQLLA